MTRPEIAGISPFFIVQDSARALSFYRDRLGFEVTFQEPADDPFFGIVRRGGAMIMFKGVGVDPLPNYKREAAARWDAYLYVPDPDALAAEFASRNVEFSEPLKDTNDGLRGFELKDSDGYVLFFGRPPNTEIMTATMAKPRVTSLAPQFLVDDLARSVTYYQKLGFTFGESWDGFYAIGQLDGLELHLKEAPKNDDERRHRRANDHLDAAAGVDGIEAFYAQCTANGATIIKPLTATPWGTKDFYVEDPDGYVVCFGGRPAAD